MNDAERKRENRQVRDKQNDAERERNARGREREERKETEEKISV